MKKNKKLLLHTCCMSCGANVINELLKDYSVTLYFHNPNIFPLEEYNKRLNETKRIAKDLKYDLIIEKYNHKNWSNLIKGLENEPEKGKRCKICFKERLEKTKLKAMKLGFNYFSTTLTVSPHKDSNDILEIGLKLQVPNELHFLDKDFKKNNGYKKAILLAKKLNLYRQSYCGCEYSIKNKIKINY